MTTDSSNSSNSLSFEIVNNLDKNIFLAQLLQQCNCLKESRKFLILELKSRDKNFSKDERILFASVNKNLLLGIRDTLLRIQIYEKECKKKKKLRHLNYLKEYKKKVYNELTQFCEETIALLDNILLKRAEDDESKVYYLKMKADYYRYLTEYADEEVKRGIVDKSQKAYDEAFKLAENIPIFSYTRLGLILNLAVFYHETMNDHKKAIEISGEGVKKAALEMKGIDENEEGNVEIVKVYKALKDSYEIWKNDEIKEY